MNRNVLTVAKWEFFRFFKWRDQIAGVISLLVTSVIGFGVVKFVQNSNRVDLAVIGRNEAIVFPPKSIIKLTFVTESTEQLRSQLENKKIDGVLSILPRDDSSNELDVNLLVRKKPSWLKSLQGALNQLKTTRAMDEAHLTAEQRNRMLLPQSVSVTCTAQHAISISDQVVAVAMGGAMVLVSFLGLSFFMTGITGEKQQRITEQIVSAISPQAWIDGKLIGLTAASFASAGALLLTGLAMYGIAWLMGYALEFPDSLTRWELVPVLMVLFLGGAIFWNCFYAAASSIINDPNTSARSGLLFVPILPLSAGFLALPQPDGIPMRMLSLIPGASSTAMPIRLFIGDVAWWELIVCLVGLVVGIAFLRLIAGRIFAAGIMLYGKEPGWFEILRWAVLR